MNYEPKYLVGEIGEKADALWAEHPDVMMAVGKEAIRAWKTGFKKGFLETSAVITIGAAVVGAAAVAIYKIKNRKKVMVIQREFEDFED